jgi:hypothetical protein
MSPAYPATLDFAGPDQIARWRPLVHWILVIPQMIIVAVLGFVAGVILLISFFAILFTRRIPEGLFNFQVMSQRYSWRAYSYAWFMRESYPPFEFPMSASDPADDPAALAVEPPELVNRWLPLVKWLLAIPHQIVLFVLWFVTGILVVIAFFYVIFTGRYPLGIRNFLIGYARWYWRVWAYTYLLRDEYPPFSLEP